MTDKEKDRDANNTTDPIEPVEAEIVDLEPEVEAESYEGEETQDEVETLLQDLAQARAEANEYLDGWQRSRAEFVTWLGNRRIQAVLSPRLNRPGCGTEACNPPDRAGSPRNKHMDRVTPGTETAAWTAASSKGVGDTGLEPVTSCMSSMRSSQLS